MKKEISVKTKIKEGRGTGKGAFYIPWTFISDFNSTGTASSFTDWIHGRAVQLLSLAELYIYLKYRFMNDVEDIREQFPLNMKINDGIKTDIDMNPDDRWRYTIEIAESHPFKHPEYEGSKVPLSTDLLIIKTDGSLLAISCKCDKNSLKKQEHKRDKEKLIIEKEYWESRGVEWKLDFPTEKDQRVAHNLMSASHYYDKSTVKNDVTLLKHLVITRQIELDLTKPIMWVRLAKEMRANGQLDQYSKDH